MFFQICSLLAIVAATYPKIVSTGEQPTFQSMDTGTQAHDQISLGWLAMLLTALAGAGAGAWLWKNCRAKSRRRQEQAMEQFVGRVYHGEDCVGSCVLASPDGRVVTALHVLPEEGKGLNVGDEVPGISVEINRGDGLVLRNLKIVDKEEGRDVVALATRPPTAYLRTPTQRAPRKREQVMLLSDPLAVDNSVANAAQSLQPAAFYGHVSYIAEGEAVASYVSFPNSSGGAVFATLDMALVGIHTGVISHNPVPSSRTVAAVLKYLQWGTAQAAVFTTAPLLLGAPLSAQGLVRHLRGGNMDMGQ
uniref:Serine protease n=1 Tax=Chlamydomonas leiostraca TaxID=1034604 RepID=A0A7S0REA5_9CHLO|mmetsp:Transcript_2055/g.5233  ORF Transcript_2055/g.5233 Transcript_2055/m.5233 type:complete len:305 (+) Transcript_2055:43-957(+)|eukprot:CAMPEP_0202878086 /NCGR_PEP_ID=MMETSP1391-20130828/31620_1 /ASSEMBLY_ACC=CAM_ASM_000867 /TAXON_ID=1034604 /ORGANISM="Chlamydomonas leiostraca, Strain SAG 11-49" /LENGTH=304 /DNA_ID=CAMNT_0049560219 /DNA_START=60 /DNA_END=974 /DNA_ORIENTATION=-